MTHSPLLLGMGSYLPDAVLTNDDLTRIVDTTDEWIVTRTGIRERHIIAKGQNNSDLALAAATEALQRANIAPADLTHVLVATCTPDSACPATACILANKLGANKGVFSLDLNAACSGYVYGLSLVRDILTGNPDATILLVGSEALSSRVDWTDRSTCVLFGDGAGAGVFRSGGQSAHAGSARLVDVAVFSDGSLCDLLHIDGGGTSAPYQLGDTVGKSHFIQMDGREVYKHAVRNMAACCRAMLEKNGLTVADLGCFIPHQANLRIIEAVGSKLGVSAEQVFVNVDKVGNTSAASIPLAMSQAFGEGRIKPGMPVMVTAFGGGLTWGAALLRF